MRQIVNRRLAGAGCAPDTRGMSDVVESVIISLNGEDRGVPAGLTVAGLIGALGLDTRKVAVERNREIVPRSTYEAVTLSAGDELEIVHFIGGG